MIIQHTVQSVVIQAWLDFAINCATLEGNYGWDCSGCACPGDLSCEEQGLVIVRMVLQMELDAQLLLMIVLLQVNVLMVKYLIVMVQMNVGLLHGLQMVSAMMKHKNGVLT